MDKFSYGLGMGIGQNLLSMNVSNLEFNDFLNGLKAVLNKEKSEISHEEAQKVVSEFFNKAAEEANANIKESGIAFLMENGKRANIKTLPSGLQYEVLVEGTGKKPTANDRVQCHYEGTLIDGTIFDSSVRRGEPAVFGVSQVIAGWVEALQLMNEGSKWRLFIPQELAYGAHGAGEQIPPFSALVFEVELIKIV